eukprot:360899-Chlamydomonas_euryale.AAC.1
MPRCGACLGAAPSQSSQNARLRRPTRATGSDTATNWLMKATGRCGTFERKKKAAVSSSAACDGCGLGPEAEGTAPAAGAPSPSAAQMRSPAPPALLVLPTVPPVKPPSRLSHRTSSRMRQSRASRRRSAMTSCSHTSMPRHTSVA